MRYVIDSYAWIEYFLGSSSGMKVKECIENSDNEIITNSLNLAEISSYCARNNLDDKEIIKIVFSNSKIFHFKEDFSIEAGILHAEIRKKIKDFGLTDSFVLLTARKINAKIITGDEHFRNFRETVMIN